MASPPLVLPGVLFVGEDERARVVAHLGPSAGWFVPAGIERWSHEVSVVPRDTLTEDIRRQTKLVMPEEQIPPAKMPLTLQAAMKSPLVAVTSRLAPKLVELGVRVHTVGVDRVTSSFYYLAEGGGEDAVRVEGDLVASVGAMLGERADNAAIERVLDGLVDRLLRSLSHDRVTELSIELAAALPRAAADGTGAQDVELEEFEKALAALLGSSEKFSALAQDIAGKLAESHERKLDVALFGEAKKTSMGPFDLMVGERKVALATYERWVMSGPLDESKSKPLPDVAAQADVAAAAAAKAKADANAAAAKLKADAAAAKAKADADVAEARAKAERAKADDAALKAKAEAEAQAELAVQAELAAQAKADADAKARAAEQEAAAAKAKAEAAAKASEDAKKASDSKPDAKAAEAKRDAAKAKAATAKSSDPKPKAFDQKAVARAAETKPVVAAKSSMTTILLVIVAFVIGFVVIKMFFLK